EPHSQARARLSRVPVAVNSLRFRPSKQLDDATARRPALEGLALTAHYSKRRKAKRRTDTQLNLPLTLASGEAYGTVDPERSGSPKGEYVPSQTANLAGGIVDNRVELTERSQLVGRRKHRKTLSNGLAESIAVLQSSAGHPLQKQLSPLGRDRRNRPVLVERGSGQHLALSI